MQFNNVQPLISTIWWTKLPLAILPGLSQLGSGTYILPYNNILATNDKTVQGLPQVDNDLDVERFHPLVRFICMGPFNTASEVI